MEQTTHVLVPKHVIASQEEIKGLVDRIKRSVEALPIILVTDPALAALDAKPGDVIRIERSSPVTQKTENYYRFVVDDE